MMEMPRTVRRALQHGTVIPAHPLALDGDGRFDERRQRALTRYYAAAGAGGLAIGVHTTQFAIRDPNVSLEPLAALRAKEMDRADARGVETADSASVASRVRSCSPRGDFSHDAATTRLLTPRGDEDSNVTPDRAHARRSAHDPLIVLTCSRRGRRGSLRFWRRLPRSRGRRVKIAPFNRFNYRRRRAVNRSRA